MRRSNWDRIKILVGIAGLLGFLGLARAGSELVPFDVGFVRTVRSLWWLVALGLVEAARQLYYLWIDASPERLAALEAREEARARRKPRLDDWTRFRLARYAKWGLVLLGVDYAAASALHVSLLEALYQLPALFLQALPLILQLVALLAFAVLQFVAIFGFLAQGGIDTYYPGDIKTRFSDVWGQDAVLERIKENLVFLQHPEEIEAKGGYVPGGILLYGPPGPQPLTAQVLTPAGWRKMGELQVGDAVVTEDGTAAQVKAVYDFGEEDVYRVIFSDGAETRATAGHIWAVQSKKMRRRKYSSDWRGKYRSPIEARGTRWRAVTTAELVGGKKRGNSPHSVPIPRGWAGVSHDLPLHPYVLGCLLGDGSLLGMSQIQLTTSWRKVADRVAACLPASDELRGGVRWQRDGVGTVQWRICRRDARRGSKQHPATRDALDLLGLTGARSCDKFIPQPYLDAPFEQRLELLRGLMDTDGGFRKSLYYASTSSKLLRDVAYLVRSLGGVATVHEEQVVFRLPDDVDPFGARDDKRKKRRTQPPVRYVREVKYDGREPVRCIEIDSPSHLYVTDDFVVTHNTGKTLMAEAMAGEAGVPYVFVEPAAFNNMFFGVGVLKVRSLFRRLRKLAVKFSGAIVFFDEADSLGSRGGAVGGGGWDKIAAQMDCSGVAYLSDAGRAVVQRDKVVVPAGTGGGFGTLQALLAEMSGLKKPRGFWNRYVRRMLGMRPKPPPHYRILVVMATNLPEALDEALLRPGRLDRIYKVGYPSLQGRIRTYEGYFAKIAHELTHEQIVKLATMTPYATGAVIKDIVNEALINAMRNGREAATWEDVIKAKHLKDLGPPEDTEYVQRERHAIAVHEACHAVIAYRQRKHLVIDIATIEKGGTYLGMVTSIKPEDTYTQWKSDYEADIMVSLASLAGERLFFDGDNTSGVSGDLMSATKIATYMEGYWGMGSTLSVHGTLKEQGISPGGWPREKNEQLDPALGERIEATLRRLFEEVKNALDRDRFAVLRLAHALETHRTLSGDDVRAVIEMTRGPLVDGTVYLGREAELEAYHAASVEARRLHREQAVPLPVFTATE